MVGQLEKEYDEIVSWVSPNECELKQFQRVPVIGDDESDLRGYQVTETATKYKKDELQGNYEQRLIKLQNLEGQLKQSVMQLENVQKQFELLGVGKVKTPEMVKLEKNLQALSLLKQLEQAKSQEAGARKAFDSEKSWLDKRKVTLESAPKA